MQKTKFIIFSWFGLIPIYFIAFGKLNLIVISLAVIYLLTIPFALKVSFSHNQNAVASKIIFLILITLILSYINMITWLGKFTTLIVIWTMNYGLFWVMLKEITTFDKIDKLISYIGKLTLVGIVLLFLFFLFPSLLEGPLDQGGMGSFRGYELGVPRIFTPSMIYVGLAIIYILVLFFYKRTNKNKIKLLVFLSLSLFSIIIICSIRTYLVGIFFSFAYLLLLNSKVKTKIVIALITIISVVLITFFLNSKMEQELSNRFLNIYQISNFDLKGAVYGDVSYGQDEFGTLYWRILEIGYATQFLDSTNKILFGAMGLYYNFQGVIETLAPHISYFGIYYLFGILGSIAFGLLIIYFSFKVVKVRKIYKGHKYEYLATVLVFVVFDKLLYGFGGGIFDSDQSIIIIVICTLVVVLENLFHIQHKEFYA